MADSSSSLTFQSTNLDVVSRDGQPWLRLPQVGAALGYENPHKVQQVYDRNSAEFTDSMTALVKLPTAGGEQTVRIFSLRGAHLLGMFARTPKAAEFRRWVLDILESPTQARPQADAASDTLTASEQQTLKEVVHRKAAQLGSPAEQGRVLASIWSRLQNKFRVARYHQLPRHLLADAVIYVSELGSSQASPAQTQRVPLSAAKRKELSRLIEVTAMGARFKNTWRAAVWAQLRRELDSPSPEPLYEDQVPVIVRELQSVILVSRQLLNLTHSIETQFMRRILRQQEDLGSVMQELQGELEQKLLALPAAPSLGVALLAR